MEKFSQITYKKRIPIKIRVFSYLLDHQFMGRAVIPAVEAMRILVDSVQPYIENIKPTCIIDGTFDKFIFIGEQDHIEAFNDFEVRENGLVQTKLVSRFKSGKSSITRFIEHVTINLSFFPKPSEKITFDPGTILGAEPFEIAPDIIYKELVPFGPAYQNIREPVLMSLNGAVASVYGGDPAGPEINCLGSPFVLDAAFHAACVWGQRYHHIVAFPVGFNERHISRPTCFGKTYVALILPVHADKTLLVFDIRICDRAGKVHETISGVRMRDVSGGRLKPPEWILYRT